MKYLTAFIFILFSCSASAAFQPTKVTQVVSNTGGATATTVFSRTTAANQAVYDVRAVQVAKSSVANAVRSRSFSPWGFALVTAITAAGYYLDEQSQDIVVDNAAYEGWGNCQANPNMSVQTSLSTCFNAFQSTGTGKWWYPAHMEQINDTTVDFKSSNGTKLAYWFSYTPIPPDTNLEGGITPVTDDDLYQLAQTMSPSQFHDLFEDPVTGLPNTADMPEFDTVANDVEADYQAANDSDPNTNPTTDPATGDTGTQNQTENEPEDKDPCVLNPALLVCSELDDVPDPTQIQTQAINFDYSPYSLSSNAVCPAPLPLPNGLTLSYQPACDFASGVSPVVILVFSMIGLYILSGYRTSD